MNDQHRPMTSGRSIPADFWDTPALGPGPVDGARIDTSLPTFDTSVDLPPGEAGSTNPGPAAQPETTPTSPRQTLWKARDANLGRAPAGKSADATPGLIIGGPHPETDVLLAELETSLAKGSGNRTRPKGLPLTKILTVVVVAVMLLIGAGLLLLLQARNSPIPAPSTPAGYAPLPERTKVWELEIPSDVSSGLTRLGVTMVRPGALGLYSIEDGSKVFETSTTGPVETLFAAAKPGGGEDTLYWVSGRQLWWWNDAAHNVDIPNGCAPTAAGGGVLLSCADAPRILTVQGKWDTVDTTQVVLGTDGANVVEAGLDGFTIAGAKVALEGVTESTMVRPLGVGRGTLFSVWKSPDGFLLATHDHDGALLDSAPIQQSDLADGLERSVGNVLVITGKVITDSVTGEMDSLPARCRATEGAGQVVQVHCNGVDLVWVGGELYQGPWPVVAGNQSGTRQVTIGEGVATGWELH